MSEEKKNQPEVRDLEPNKDAKGGGGHGHNKPNTGGRTNQQ